MGGHRDNPDVQQFKWAFRHTLVDKLFSSNVGSNCEVDFDKILLDIQSIFNPQKNDSPNNLNISLKTSAELSYIPFNADQYTSLETSVEPSCSSSALSMGLDLTVESEECLTYTDISLPLSLEVENVAAYIAGFLLKKSGFLQANACNECLKLFSVPEARQSDNFVFIKCKEYKPNSCLIYPSLTFTDFVGTLELIFNSHIESLLYVKSGVIMKLYSIAASTAHLQSCGELKCNELINYMRKLYMTVRIHFKIKIMNRNTVLQQATKRNRKVKKILHV